MDALNRIHDIINKKSVKVKTIESICGLPNFLTKAIRLGRAFIRRLYNAIQGKPHFHHVPVTKELKADLGMWIIFLQDFKFTRPIPTFINEDAYDLQLLTDSSASHQLGFGCYFQGKWIQGKWPKQFISSKPTPSIALLKLILIAVAITLWADNLQDKHVILFSDNQTVVTMVNKSTSPCPYCMPLIRLIVMHCLYHNIELKCHYLPGFQN